MVKLARFWAIFLPENLIHLHPNCNPDSARPAAQPRSATRRGRSRAGGSCSASGPRRGRRPRPGRRAAAWTWRKFARNWPAIRASVDIQNITQF